MILPPPADIEYKSPGFRVFRQEGRQDGRSGAGCAEGGALRWAS